MAPAPYDVDAPFYDDVNGAFDADVGFYADYAAQTPGAIIELACGTGRLTLPLARSGRRVVGLDASAAMLERAVHRIATEGSSVPLDVVFLMQDMRRFDLPETFGLCVCAYNSFQHLLTLEDQLSCLTCIRRHLDPKGLFVFDVLNPDFQYLQAERRNVPKGSFLSRDFERTVTLTENTAYDRGLQIYTVGYVYRFSDGLGEKVTESHFQMRQVFPRELDLLLRTGGFDVVERFGDFRRQPFEGASPHQIMVCRPVEGAR